MSDHPANMLTFGGADHVVEDFTLDELQDVAPLIDSYYAHMASREGKDGIGVAKQIVAAALRREEAEIGTAFKTNLDELYAAVGTVAEIAGLKKLGERFRKEKAEREAASKVGTTSTPSS